MKKSFTMVELLVTLGVIAALTAFTLPQLGKVKVRTNLKNTALEIQSSILEAKNYSLAPRAVPGTASTKIQSYAIVFYGPSYSASDRRNTYEILEYQDSGSNSVWQQPKKLPTDVEFEAFNWVSSAGAKKRAEIKFLVEKQGEIITDFTCEPCEAKIKINKTGYKPWTVSVIKATGAVSVKED